MLPQIPIHLNIPNPVSNGYVEQYLPYLMTDAIDKNEQYTYRSRINGHLLTLTDFQIDKYESQMSKVGDFIPTTLFGHQSVKDSHRVETNSNIGIFQFDIDQVNFFTELLKVSPGTNQAVLQVAEPSDVFLSDPPCLRHIDMRIRRVPDREKMQSFYEAKYRERFNDTISDKEIYEEITKCVGGKFTEEQLNYICTSYLVFYPYFRSWDLWGGFPANCAGLAVLQKDMADNIGVQTGPMICTSKGLHLYGYVEELAKIRSYKNGN